MEDENESEIFVARNMNENATKEPQGTRTDGEGQERFEPVFSFSNVRNLNSFSKIAPDCRFDSPSTLSLVTVDIHVCTVQSIIIASTLVSGRTPHRPFFQESFLRLSGDTTLMLDFIPNIFTLQAPIPLPDPSQRYFYIRPTI